MQELGSGCKYDNRVAIGKKVFAIKRPIKQEIQLPPITIQIAIGTTIVLN